MRHFVAALSIMILCTQLSRSNFSAQTAKTGVQTLAGDNNAFVFDLYSRLSTNKGNLFFSPESIFAALAILYPGAAGETQKEMASTLHLSPEFTHVRQQLVPAVARMLKDLNSRPADHSYQLTVADALWLEKNFAFKSDYLSLVRNEFAVELKLVSFRTAPESARGIINQWVAQATAQKIMEIIPAGVLDSSTRLVLTNAIYFKGDWLSSFDKAATHDEDFHPAPGSNHAVPMMHKTGDFRYFESGDFRELELPYKGKDLSMVIFLPSAEQGLSAFESTLRGTNLETWLSQLHPVSEVQVTLPKFKMESEFELSNALAALGMRQAFSRSQADFSGIVSSPKAANLYLSKVLHKAYVDVNEEGTEAAAATGIVARSMAMRRPTVFRADHPFVFLIRDNRSGAILFIGRVADPAV